MAENLIKQSLDIIYSDILALVSKTSKELIIDNLLIRQEIIKKIDSYIEINTFFIKQLNNIKSRVENQIKILESCNL